MDHNVYYGYSVYRFVTYNFLFNRHIRFKKELLQKTDQHINTIDSPLPFELLYKTKDADSDASYKIELKGKKFIRRISLYIRNTCPCFTAFTFGIELVYYFDDKKKLHFVVSAKEVPNSYKSKIKPFSHNMIKTKRSNF